MAVVNSFGAYDQALSMYIDVGARQRPADQNHLEFQRHLVKTGRHGLDLASCDEPLNLGEPVATADEAHREATNKAAVGCQWYDDEALPF